MNSKYFFGLGALALVALILMAAAPPAPIYRNAWTTNAGAGPVHGANNLQITNDNDLIWSFFSGSTSTVARLADTNGLATTNYVNAVTNNVSTNTLELGWFGDGSDGNVVFDGTTTVLGMVPSSTVYTMTNSLFLSSMVVSNGAAVKPNGWTIYCSGILTNNGSITNNGGSGGNGGAATTAGAGGTPNPGSGDVGGGPGLGQNGGTGANGAGNVGGAQTTQSGSGGGFGGGGGMGGSAAGGAGGSATVTDLGTANKRRPRFLTPRLMTVSSSSAFSLFNGAQATGAAGGGGAGTGAAPGAGGGGGGCGGGVVAIYSQSVINTGTISCNGGNGGNGGNASNVGAAGGGGAGGGGGGLVYMVYGSIANSGTITATAGTFGTGGTGNAANNGTNGRAGGDGLVIKYNLRTHAFE